MIPRLTLCTLFLIGLSPLFAQPGYTANERVEPYTGHFAYGSNMGYYSPWRDEQLANIAAGNPQLQLEGVGVNALRPALFAYFVEQYGYDARVEAFQHYQQLGIHDVTVFVGYPADHQRDQTHHCPSSQSEMFKNLYTDIWDDGEDGTPVNDDNDYALYLYKLLQHYKDYTSIYEIWNEPDFDHSGDAWKPASMPDSWWHNNPQPCDYALKAPVFEYIRMLRISYEVIKTFDPDAYIAVGGFGFPSFLDVVLRNTDNPDNGQTSAEYPLKGGAYFDMMSFHSYPHIDGSLREWNNDIKDFDYFRHSDAAADGVIYKKKEFEAVLHQYGYDGTTFPKKEYIITEGNVPRKTFGDFMGSDEAQRNFILKTLVELQREGVRQYYVYQLAESKGYDEAEKEFHLMGLYKKIKEVPPYQQVPTNAGIAHKTISDLLQGFRYDALLTEELQAPEGIRAAAFSKPGAEPVYVLWAETRIDRNEAATAHFVFPGHLKVEQLLVKEWNHSATAESLLVEGKSLQLTGSPVFVQLNPNNPPKNKPGAFFSCTPNPFSDTTQITFKLTQASEVSLAVYDLKGRRLKVLYNEVILPAGVFQKTFDMELESGLYICQLEVEGVKYTERLVKVKE